MIRTIKPEAANIRTNAGKVIQSSPVIITNDGYDPPIQRLRTNAGKAIQVVSSQQVIEIVRPELMRVGGKPRGSGSGSYLFEDKCNSETLPSGVTTNQPIFYDSVNQIRYFTANTSRYILPNLGAIQDKAICISGHIKTDATKKTFYVGITVNNTLRYALNHQVDPNVALYRIPDGTYTGFTGGFNANQERKFEMTISIDTIWARVWVSNSNYYAYPVSSHSHFSMNSSDNIGCFIEMDGTTINRSANIKYIRVIVGDKNYEDFMMR